MRHVSLGAVYTPVLLDNKINIKEINTRVLCQSVNRHNK